MSNTDHTLMQGVELVNRLLLGEPEQTIGIKYESTLDGRNAATHERSHLAGSGDPKRAVVSVGAKGNPDGVALAQPGKSELKLSIRATAPVGHRDAGDKREVHTSEEELGVTTPIEDGAEK